MSVAVRSFSLLLLGLTLAACTDARQEAAANNAAATEIEALPPDESVATPTDELGNGPAEPSNADETQY